MVKISTKLGPVEWVLEVPSIERGAAPYRLADGVEIMARPAGTQRVFLNRTRVLRGSRVIVRGES